MAPDGDLGCITLDKLKKKGQEIAIARAEEDTRRKARKVKEDRTFEASWQSKFTAVEREGENRLAEQGRAAQSAIDAMEKLHAQELAELRKRQAGDITVLETENDKKRADVEDSVVSMKNTLRHGMLREDDMRREMRNQNDETLELGRATEDDEIKNAVSVAFEAEILQGSGGIRKQVSSASKRQHVDAIKLSPAKKAPSRMVTRQVSKRQKLNPETEEDVSTESPSGMMLKRMKAGFELQGTYTTDQNGMGLTWHFDGDYEEVRLLRYDAESNALGVYSDIGGEITECPTLWALDTTKASNVYFDRPMGRLATFNEFGWLRLEFYKSSQLETFIEICRTHFPKLNLIGDHEIARERWGEAKTRGAEIYDEDNDFPFLDGDM